MNIPVTSRRMVQLTAMAIGFARLCSSYDATSSDVATLVIVLVVDGGHGAFREVASLGELPLVVDLDQHAAGQDAHKVQMPQLRADNRDQIGQRSRLETRFKVPPSCHTAQSLPFSPQPSPNWRCARLSSAALCVS